MLIRFYTKHKFYICYVGICSMNLNIFCLNCFLDLDPFMKIMSRRVVGRRLSEATENVKMGLKASLQHQKHVCTTADIWSTKHRSFMGVTVHWVRIKLSFYPLYLFSIK